MPSDTVAPVDAASMVQRRSADARVAGGLLLTFGTGWLLQSIGLDLSWEAIIAGVLLALGVAMMVTPRGGQGMKLWFLGLALTLGLASMSSVSTSLPGGGVSQTVHAPMALADVRSTYEQTAGEFTLDLTKVELPLGQKTIAVDQGAGQLSVIVPDGLAVRVEAQFTAGDLVVFGEDVASGLFVRKVWVSPNYRTAETKVLLRLRTTAGQISVRHPGDPIYGRRTTFRGFNG